MNTEDPRPLELYDVPSAVADLLNLARGAVYKLWQIELDLTPETLPIVDQYLREIPANAAADIRRLAISTAGCYFGEVARRVLNGRWRIEGDDPRAWRVELCPCYLHFSPVGMAGEVQTQKESDDFDGNFLTSPQLHEQLENMLRTAAPFSEGEYYSLCGRLEVLELVTDWLVNKAIADGDEPHEYTAQDYHGHFAQLGQLHNHHCSCGKNHTH